MFNRKRYAIGFKFGKSEHRFRKYTTRLIICSVLSLGAWWYFRQNWIIFVGIGFLVLTVLANLIADISHRLEKKFMDKMRFGKRK